MTTSVQNLFLGIWIALSFSFGSAEVFAILPPDQELSTLADKLREVEKQNAELVCRFGEIEERLVRHESSISVLEGQHGGREIIGYIRDLESRMSIADSNKLIFFNTIKDSFLYIRASMYSIQCKLVETANHGFTDLIDRLLANASFVPGADALRELVAIVAKRVNDRRRGYVLAFLSAFPNFDAIATKVAYRMTIKYASELELIEPGDRFRIFRQAIKSVSLMYESMLSNPLRFLSSSGLRKTIFQSMLAGRPVGESQFIEFLVQSSGNRFKKEAGLLARLPSYQKSRMENFTVDDVFRIIRGSE